MIYTQIFIISHQETDFDRLPVLFLRSPIGILYALLFRNNALYSSFNSGAKLIINLTENDVPILHHSEDGTDYYLIFDWKYQ